ncbi:hypothetical protein DFH09DRAFT_1091262 [Mycena vulgaris]|nr:hypothetical protein DFH09DRAFT_1091262 [Mycena vulgaris]
MHFDELAAPEPEENFLEGWVLWACDHPLSLTIHADVVACFEKPRPPSPPHTFQLDQYDKSLVDFLDRHSSHLRNLSVEHPAVKSFPPLPALTTLKTYPSSERDAEFTAALFGRLEDPQTRFLPSIQHIILPTFDSLNPTDFATMGRALSSRWNRHHSNSPADVAEIRSLTLDIGLAGEKTLACFEEVLSPLTGLKAGGVDVCVDIGTWFPLSDSNDADLADDGSNDSGDDYSNGSEGDGSNLSEGDGSDDSRTLPVIQMIPRVLYLLLVVSL